MKRCRIKIWGKSPYIIGTHIHLYSFILLFFSAFMFITVSSYGKGPLFFTEKGTAVVIEGNRRGAAKLAARGALNRAVSKAIESVLRKGTEEERDYDLKRGEIMKGPFPFITSTKVIAEVMKGKVLTITVRAGVDRKKLIHYLKGKGVLSARTKARKKKEFPSITVIMVEEIGGQVNSFPFSTGVIVDDLVKNRFLVVDDALVRKSINHDRAVQGILAGDSRAAEAMALQYGSGILITGRAIALKGSLKSGGLQSYGANVSLHAVRADSGKIIATASAAGSYPHIESITGSRKSIEIASKKAIETLEKKLEENFGSSEEFLLVSVRGINYSQLSILKRILSRDFKTISSIKQKSYAGGVAKLNLVINGSTQDFSERVVFKDFGSFKLDVLSYSPGKIDFVLKMKGKHN